MLRTTPDGRVAPERIGWMKIQVTGRFVQAVHRGDGMWRFSVVVAGLPLLLGGAAAWVLGQSAEVGQAQRGERLYRIHCASCHGTDGRGEGPMREVLTRLPTDLTRLDAAGNLWVESARDVLTGASARWCGVHGRREMPVWGVSFVDRGRVAGQREEVEAEIDSLLEFLREIQASRRQSP